MPQGYSSAAAIRALAANSIATHTARKRQIEAELDQLSQTTRDLAHQEAAVLHSVHELQRSFEALDNLACTDDRSSVACAAAPSGLGNGASAHDASRLELERRYLTLCQKFASLEKQLDAAGEAPELRLELLAQLHGVKERASCMGATHLARRVATCLNSRGSDLREQLQASVRTSLTGVRW